MLNHARTLLLNRTGTANLKSYNGYEYVPERYTAMGLTSTLQNVSAILFHGMDTPTNMNLRVKQYMHILHSTEYESYITALDTRITYEPSNPVTASFEPAKSLIDIVVDLRNVKSGMLDPIFLDMPIDFKILWMSAPFLFYQLSGVLLAMIYQIEKLRTG